MTARVLVFGSINIDHVYRVPHFVQPGETLASETLETGLGGKGANQSMALARAGANVSHIGRIARGDAWAIKVLASDGVDVSQITQIEGASGHAIIQVDDRGENAIILHGGANQSFALNELEVAVNSYPDAEYLLVQNECNLLTEAFELAAKKNLKVVLNPAPMTSEISALPLQQLDTLIVNEGEAQDLSGKQDIDDIISVLRDLMPNTRIVITLGEQGAVMLSDQKLLRVAATPVSARDTTGAGDTFVGYFLAGLISGLEDSAALSRACQAAGIAVTRKGAISSIPTISELN
jgi:ribokinase